MPCFSPIEGFRAPGGQVKFTRAGAFIDRKLSVPCGQCIGCRIDRSKAWAARCLLEASLHERNCFITLTYHDMHLPHGNTLVLEHFQLFMKRLRARYGSGIRFFHCGEYGEQRRRPHYHALLFNHDFADRVLFSQRDGIKLHTSEQLSSLWTYGFSTVGDLTFETAAYTARYVMKKVSGPLAEIHYEHTDNETGEISQLKPEYVTMSRRPGIGREWYKKYKNDLWPDDFLVIRGRKTKIPKFYDNQLSIEHPEECETIKRNRIRKSLKHKANNTPERLAVRERVLQSRVNLLKRNLDQ